MRKNLHCDSCGGEREHQDIRAEFKLDSKVARVVFVCGVCGATKGPMEVPKAEFFGTQAAATEPAQAS